MSYNRIILVGNLTRDIEIKYTQSGAAIANTAIATSRKFTQDGERKEEVCFVDITFFGKSAEVANQYLRKGSKLLVEGRLKFDQWVGQDGAKHSKHSVQVDTMQMLDSRPAAQPQQEQPQYQPPQQSQPQYQQSQQYQPPQSHRDYQPPRQQPQQQMPQRQMQIDIDEDEIPF